MLVRGAGQVSHADDDEAGCSRALLFRMRRRAGPLRAAAMIPRMQLTFKLALIADSSAGEAATSSSGIPPSGTNMAKGTFASGGSQVKPPQGVRLCPL